MKKKRTSDDENTSPEEEIVYPGYESFLGLEQEDPKLESYVRDYLLEPPSAAPYNLTHPEKEHFSEHGQTQHAISKYLHNMVNIFSPLGLMVEFAVDLKAS